MALLEARGVSYLAGRRRIVDQASLQVQAGEVVALVGPNGAGKSTLLSLLAGDLPPSEGEVTLDGFPLLEYGARSLALRRAVLPQQTVLQFAFTAREVVMMGRSALRTARARNDRRLVDDALEHAEALELADRSFPTLSGGEQARVTLARILVQETPVLLLDEPTASLDIRHQEMVMRVVRDLASEGTAVLAVLHDLNLAAAYADRVAVLQQGRVVAFDVPSVVMNAGLLSEVFDHPISVIDHPIRDCPLIMPLPSPSRRVTASYG